MSVGQPVLETVTKHLNICMYRHISETERGGGGGGGGGGERQREGGGMEGADPETAGTEGEVFAEGEVVSNWIQTMV